jgi:hypothetical protein
MSIIVRKQGSSEDVKEVEILNPFALEINTNAPTLQEESKDEANDEELEFSDQSIDE